MTTRVRNSHHKCRSLGLNPNHDIWPINFDIFISWSKTDGY